MDLHRKLFHENIVKLYTACEDSESVYLFLEYAERGNLFFIIRSRQAGQEMSEAEAFFYFIQTCSGLHFLHAKGLMHRDLKPENLLVSDQKVLKICDFGWCVESNQGERATFCGTLEYMAPEMMSATPSYGASVDVWALGILLYELRHGHAPFPGHSPQELCKSIERGLPPAHPASTPAYLDLLHRLLTFDPRHRLPLEAIFEHPWVRHFEHQMFPSLTPPSFAPASEGRGPHVKVLPSAALGAMRKGTVEESVIEEE